MESEFARLPRGRARGESARFEVWFLLSGVGLLGSLLGWTLLSSRFIYGFGHAERPILEFLFCYGLSWLFFLIAVFLTWSRKGRGRLAPLLGIALLARAILLPSELIQENDVYRYVLDGQVSIHGGNPFEFSPWEVVEKGSPRLRSSLQSEEARTVLERIGYPQIPTVYPPLPQAVFALGALAGGWDWRAQRLLLLLVDLWTLGVLVVLLGRLEVGRGWLVLYAWNPLVLKEIANSSHFDGLVAVCLALLLLSLVAFRGTSGWGWLTLSAIALAAAVLSKLYPVLLVPAALIFVWRVGRSWKQVAWLAAVSGVIVILGFAPFAGLGPERLFRGVLIYAADWRMNEGFFSLLDRFLPQPRWWASALCALVAAGLPALTVAGNERELARQFGWVILIWFLVMPSPFPWYAIPLLMLIVVSDSRPILLAALMLSGSAGLYYLRFYFEYHDFDSRWWYWTRIIEHSLIWLALVAGFAHSRAAATSAEELRPVGERPGLPDSPGE